MRPIARPLAVAAAVVLLGFTVTACGSDDDKAADDPTSAASESSSGATDGAVDAATDTATDTATDAATDKATDGAPSATPQPAGSELCTALADIIEVVDPIEGPPAESQWDDIQEVYAALGEADLPAGTPARQREGRDAAVEAITSLSWAEAEKAFAGDSGAVPGLTAEENAKAAEFFTWAGLQCPSVLGTADPEASSVTTQ